MKMNFKYLMLVGALLAGFSSCSNDDQVTDGGLQPNGKMTTARFTLSQAGAVTRAVNAAPTDDEKEIKTAKLYIFDKDEILEKAVDFDDLTPDVGGSVTSQVVKVTIGEHFFLASVNAPAVTGIVEGTSTVAAVKQALVDITSMATITTTNGFFMTSQDVVSKNIIEGENAVNIEVGRAMAKVNVTCDGGDDATSLSGANGNGKLVDIKFLTANNPDQMYYFPVIEEGIFKTPYYGVTGVDITSYFPALAWDNDYTTDISVQSVAPGAASYLMENSNEIVRKGNTSYLLVSGKYVPTTVRNNDNTADGTLPTSGTFYRLYNVNNDEYYDVYIVAESKDKIEPTDFTDDAKTIDVDHPEYKGHTVNVIEYSEGISYYAFYLENSSNVSPTSPFTAKRNVYYDVTLTNVMNAGASVPNIKGNNDGDDIDDDKYIPGTGGGDGDGNNNNGGNNGGETDPLEEVCEITGTIKVLSWDVVSQTGGIGY